MYLSLSIHRYYIINIGSDKKFELIETKKNINKANLTTINAKNSKARIIKINVKLTTAKKTFIHGIFFLLLDLVLNWLKNKFRGSFTHELIKVIEKMIADQVSTPVPVK